MLGKMLGKSSEKSQKWLHWVLIGALSMAGGLAAPRSARALDPDVKAVMIAGGYGAAAGTAVGLVAWPLTGDLRSLFMGSSVGLYMGLIVGVFHIYHRDDPQNPLAQVVPERDPALTERHPVRPPLFEVHFPVYEF